MTDRNASRERESGAPQVAPARFDYAAGRRAFIQSVAAGITGTAVFGAASVGPASAQRTVSDFDILNFALNLEYLEAEFYQLAAFGRNLPADLIDGRGGAPGPVTGGRIVRFNNDATRSYAIEIANDELNHVKAIRGILGGAAFSRPAINLDTSFTAVARAAGIVPANGTFDAFANDRNFLLAAFIFEDVGVTAYSGGAPLIANPDYLTAAAKILSVEGYHAGEIRTLLTLRGEYGPVQGISDVRDSLDGGTGLDQGIGATNDVNIVPTNSSGQTYARSTTQVLNIVYANKNKQPGGFFPNGTNGNIR